MTIPPDEGPPLTPSPESPAEPSSGSRRPLLVAVVLLALAAVAVLAVWLLNRPSEEPTATPTASPATTQTASPAPTPAATTRTTPAVTPTPAPPPTGLPGAGLGPFSGGTTTDLPANPTWIRAVRTAGQQGFDRVVFEFTGAVPEYEVAYADPDFVSTSGEAVPVEGQAFLRVRLNGTSQYDSINGTLVYTGPKRVTGDTENVTEVVDVDDFEALAVWVIGLDSREPLTVTTLTDPGRLVIDIQQ